MTSRWVRALRGTQQPLHASSDVSTPLEANTPARALLVDDSAVARRALAVMLETQGFEVTTAESAREAEALIAGNEPGAFDVMLMDLHMPGGTGIDACRAIKRRVGWEDVPIIVVTSSDDDRDLAGAFAAGATDYITKPPRPIELLARVNAALRLKHEMTRRKAHERELEVLNGRLNQQTAELSAAREALATSNQDLERRVQAQVQEIRTRAHEIDTLNAELRVQVQERSRELGEALRRLAHQGRTAPAGAPGTVLGGRARLIRQIARGGMGVIFEAVDLVTGSSVAIKVLDAVPHLSRRDLQRFLGEASAASAVAHPAIVKIKHVDVSADGDPFIMMELVNGVTVETLLARGPVSPAWCVSIAQVVADALAAAHQASVIHCDVKPANLMLCWRAPGVRVLDFGISKFRDAVDRSTVTATHGLIGTPAFMAPEQLEDAAAVTGATDVFSLGAVMFQLVTGATPFRSGDLRARLLHIAAAVPSIADRAPDAPPRLAALVDRCLMPDPTARPSARDLADELAALMVELAAPPAPALLGLWRGSMPAAASAGAAS